MSLSNESTQQPPGAPSTEPEPGTLLKGLARSTLSGCLSLPTWPRSLSLLE